MFFSEFVIFLKLGFLWWKLKIFIANFCQVSPNRFWRIFSMLLKSHPAIEWRWKKKSVAITLMLNHNLTGLFANTCILPKTCLGLSWDQALLSFSWVTKWNPGRQGESKILSFSTLLVYLNYVCLRIECNNDCCITWMFINVITVTSHGP